MIELQDVTKRIGRNVHIKPTTLKLEPGHFNILLGATGSGKTSLIKLIAGLDSVSGGSIRMDGRNVTRVSTQKRNISLVHQFFVNYPQMTVFENIASPLRVARMAESEVKDRVEDAARLLQLIPVLGRRPDELSGGQQQRTALARAIAKESRAVFLDEPLANLDYKLREELREQLPDLFSGRGCVVVYATSEPEEALLFGGKVALMDDGHVVQFGPTAETYRNPESLASARIFSNPPINAVEVHKFGEEARLENGAAWPIGNGAEGLPDGKYTMAIRAHRVLPMRIADADVELNGRVLITELSGSESTAHFRMGRAEWVSLAGGVHPYRVGEDRTFFMNPRHCRYFSGDGMRVA